MEGEMIGMMWFDNSKDDLAAKMQRAAAFYRNKYGQVPNCCCVNINQQAQAPTTVGEIAIIKTIHVMPNHFWVGVREAVA